MQNKLNKILENWEKIPESFKTILSDRYSYGDSEIIPNKLIDGLSLDGHEVILLLDRQKPSVERDYSFDEERITLSKSGKIVWGFDSGCSCPSPWIDNHPNCYTCSDTWKEFEITAKDFDRGWLEEVTKKVDEIILCIK